MRGQGGYIGFNRVPAAAALNSAASGMWTLREAEAMRRAGTWPTSPPGGVGSGLQLWLDASDASTLFDATSGGSLVAADGGVARWEDKSGNGRHATQGTSDNRPLRKTSVQGSKDVLRFDGSNYFLSIPSSKATFKFLHSADSTVFAVFKSGTTANPGHANYVVFGTGHNSTTTVVGAIFYTGDSNPTTANDALYWYVSRGGQGTWPVFFDGNNYFPSNEFGLISLLSRPQDGNSANRLAMRRNGANLSSANAPQGSPQTVAEGDSTNDLTIGRLPSGESDFLNGDIAEIIIYNSALSDTDRALVESYLMSKWGIT